MTELCIGMHSFYRESKSGQGPLHARVCFCVCVWRDQVSIKKAQSHPLLTKFPLVSSNCVPRDTRHHFSLALRK